MTVGWSEELDEPFGFTCAAELIVNKDDVSSTITEVLRSVVAVKIKHSFGYGYCTYFQCRPAHTYHMLQWCHLSRRSMSSWCSTSCPWWFFRCSSGYEPFPPQHPATVARPRHLLTLLPYHLVLLVSFFWVCLCQLASELGPSKPVAQHE